MAENGTAKNGTIIGGESPSGNGFVADSEDTGIRNEAGGDNGEAFADAGAIFGEEQSGAPTANGNASDPIAGTGSASGTPGRKRRSDAGRTRGPRTAKTLPDYLSGFEGLIIGIHAGLAVLTHTPELELDETEAKNICVACDNLAQFYNVAPSPEIKLWLNLVGALGGAYAPRAIAVAARKKREREKARQAPPPNRMASPTEAFPPGVVMPFNRGAE